MRRCEDPVIRDERPTAVPDVISYNANLPWKLTTAGNNTVGYTVLMMTIWHSDFPSEF